MATGERAEPAAAGGILAAGVAYLVVTAGRVGTVYFLPELGRWTTEPPRGAVAMDWYYRAAVTLAATGVGAALGAALGARDRGGGGARLALGIGLAALAWGLVFTVLTLVSAGG